ncbi:MAG: SMP-30/gluconolactonase/LRE family protein [Verrucomicrobiae bacterium]|nr:SMP-30/gluconolactonase/LRE family protein [Verrucomicrobiae bacterium]
MSLALAAIFAAGPLKAQAGYELGPDSMVRADVPKGKVEGPFAFDQSEVFAGTSRHYWVYLPPGETKIDEELPLMVFQDGHAYVSDTGQVRVPTVFDNLIADGSIPRLVGLFVNPGNRSAGEASGADGWQPRNNRSFEYDSLGDAYVRFLVDELIPQVEKRFSVKASKDPAKNAICGMSSGGICAWTVAWERPDRFGKVLSHIGSFTNIRGGQVYPALIRKTERKPIRVFLQDGSNDLNNLHGNWPLANQQMASALAFAGYDFKFVLGDGSHSGEHGGAIFPESLRWLWRPELVSLPSPLTKDNFPGDEALSKVVEGGGKPGDWELAGEGYKFTDGLCSDGAGNVYFSDLPSGTVYRVPTDDSAPVAWLTDGPRISGMDIAADGTIYAAVQGEGESNEKRIVAIHPETKEITTIATGVNPNDLVVSDAGWVYFTDTGAGAVVRVPVGARGMSRPPVVASGINKPNGIALSPSQNELVISEYGGEHAWSFMVADSGALIAGERSMELRVPEPDAATGGDGMTVDADGRFYITSHVGIQVFDKTGRMGGVLAKPVADKGAVSCAFGGKDKSWLYLCSADKVFRRKTLVKGAR